MSCPSNSHSPSASAAPSACQCNAGFNGPNGGLCQACGEGKYKKLVGAGGCTDCEAGKFSVKSGRVSDCDLCEANTWSDTIGAMSSASCMQCPSVRCFFFSLGTHWHTHLILLLFSAPADLSVIHIGVYRAHARVVLRYHPHYAGFSLTARLDKGGRLRGRVWSRLCFQS